MALYVVRVPQAGALPTASFRFHLAMDTLAVQLMVATAKLLPMPSALDYYAFTGVVFFKTQPFLVTVSSSSCDSTYLRITSSFIPTVDTKYPLPQMFFLS